MSGEEIARRPWQADRAGEDAPPYSVQSVQSPACWATKPERLNRPAVEFATAWVAERYGLSIGLAGTIAALAGLGTGAAR